MAGNDFNGERRYRRLAHDGLYDLMMEWSLETDKSFQDMSLWDFFIWSTDRQKALSGEGEDLPIPQEAGPTQLNLPFSSNAAAGGVYDGKEVEGKPIPSATDEASGD